MELTFQKKKFLTESNKPGGCNRERQPGAYIFNDDGD